MNINKVLLYNNYNLSFSGNKKVEKRKAAKYIESPNVKQAIEFAEKIYNLSVEQINNLEFAKDLSIEILPADTMPNRETATACLDYAGKLTDDDITFSDFKIYVPTIEKDCKTCKVAYIKNIAHEYQHYLTTLNNKNANSLLCKKLKKEGVFSFNVVNLFTQNGAMLQRYLGGELMRQGVLKTFGIEGEISYNQNYGLTMTPKLITRNTVAQSIGFKNEKDMKESFKNLKIFKEVSKNIINSDSKLSKQFCDNPEKTLGTVNRILRDYLQNSFSDEANSYNAEYRLSEKYCCPDYGAKYNAVLNELFVESLNV